MNTADTPASHRIRRHLGVADDTSHDIQLDHPDVVIEEIVRLLR